MAHPQTFTWELQTESKQLVALMDIQVVFTRKVTGILKTFTFSLVQLNVDV